MMTRKRAAAWVVLALLCAAGCNGKSGPANPPSRTTPDGSGSSGTAMSKPSATATITGQKPGRPPITRLTVDVVLDNPTDAPRWFVIASEVRTDHDGTGGVDRAEVRGTGAALVGSFFGTASFHAARVAAKSKATITGLAVVWWSDSPTDAVPPITITAADEVNLGGKPVREWFGAEPLLADGAVVDASVEAGHEHRTPDGGEAALELVGGAPMKIDLAK